MTNIWVIIPAAGFGKRFGSTLPKQYHPLLDSTVLEQTLACFTAREDVAGVVLCVAENDTHAEGLACGKVFVIRGGNERSDSVANGLEFLKKKSRPNDLIAVHDAARPCVTQEDLTKVFAVAKSNPSGALLALPSSNTLKKMTDGNVTTIDRSQVYQALTPQVFRFELLTKALQYTVENNLVITDDASAIEQLGINPEIVIGHSDNIKITETGDLALAEFYMTRQRYGGAT